MRFHTLLAAVAAVGLSVQAGMAAAPAYTLTKTVPLGAPDHWDYLTFDSASHRVYVAHSDRVTVVDGRSGAILGEVTGMPGGTHGIGISHVTGQGFTDDGKAGTAIAFDLKALKVTKAIPAEPNADGIGIDPASGHVFVIDGDSAKITVIDPKTETRIATIDGGGGLEYGLFGGDGKFYVDGAEKNEIVRVDAASEKADAHWPMPGCEKPRGLAMDPAHRRLFATCGNGVMVVMGADDGHIVATLPIGQGSDAAAFDPKRGFALSSNFDGTLSIVHEKTPDTFEVLPAVATELGARTMTIDPESGRLYLVTADITVNEAAAPQDWRHRYQIAPGSARLLMLDPSP